MSKIGVFSTPSAPPFFKISGILLKTVQCDLVEIILAKFEKKLINRSLDHSARSISTIFGRGESPQGRKKFLQRVLLIPVTNLQNIGNIYIARFERINGKENRKFNFSKHDLTLKIQVKVKQMYFYLIRKMTLTKVHVKNKYIIRKENRKFCF